MLLVRGKYVWTGEKLLENAAVLCRDGQIEIVDSWSALNEAYPEVKVVGGPESLVLPGLVNAHHHGNGISSFQSGVVDDALEPWIASLATATDADPYWDTLWAAMGLLQGGYTTVAIFHGTGSDKDKAIADAQARIKACLDVGLRVALGVDVTQQNFYVYGPDPQGLPPRQGLTTEAYMDVLQTLRKQYAQEPRVAIFAAPSGPHWVSDEAWRTIGAWTKQHQIPLHTHCVESPFEAEYANRAYGGSAVRFLDDLGALHEHTALVHGVYLSEDDLTMMAERNASLITNPGSNLRLRCGISPVLHALERGVNVALGTDSCSLGERDDAFFEMRLLYYLQRKPGMNTPALTWEQALTTATVGAARVTPWSDALGVIRPGAWADFSVFDYAAVQDPWTHPDHHPLHVMLQRAFGTHVEHMVVHGEPVWERGKKTLKLNYDDVVENLRRHMHDRPSRTGTGWVDHVRAFYADWPVPKHLT